MRTTLQQQRAVIPAGFTVQKEVANNTRSFKYPDGTTRIVLHQTEIVTQHPDGSATFNTGGYWSPTTRTRMNDFCPPGWSIVQRSGRWFAQHVLDEPGTIRPFEDGMTLGLLTQTH